MTIIHASRFLIPPATASSPNNPSTFISVLILIISGLSGYIANTCVISFIANTGTFRSFGLFPMYKNN
jgi:hypothetical protein